MEYEKNSLGHLLNASDINLYLKNGILDLPAIKRAKHRRFELLQRVFETLESVSGGLYSYLHGQPLADAPKFYQDQVNAQIARGQIPWQFRDSALFFSNGDVHATVSLYLPPNQADMKNTFFSALVFNHQYAPNLCVFENGRQRSMRRLPQTG